MSEQSRLFIAQKPNFSLQTLILHLHGNTEKFQNPASWGLIIRFLFWHIAVCQLFGQESQHLVFYYLLQINRLIRIGQIPVWDKDKQNHPLSNTPVNNMKYDD